MTTFVTVIQTVAAVVQAVAGVVIILVTRKYVALTRDIAVAGQEQAKWTRLGQFADMQQRAVVLRERARSLEQRVAKLPEGPEDTAFRRAALWTPAEIDMLQANGAGAIGSAAEMAGQAAVGLTWLLDRVEEIRREPINRGYDYGRFFPEKDWIETRGQVLMNLRGLVQMADAARELAEQSAKELSARSIERAL